MPACGSSRSRSIRQQLRTTCGSSCQRLDARAMARTSLVPEPFLRATQLDAAIDAGAQFCVSPVLELDLLAGVVAAGVPFTATGMTSTEMNTAWNAGATFIKLFPASAVGPQFIRELHGPLPDIQIVPSGGVDASNAQAFLDAGAVAVGLVWRARSRHV